MANELIVIDYTDKAVEAEVVVGFSLGPLADEFASRSRTATVLSKSHQDLMPNVLETKLERHVYRAIKQGKSKIVTRELDKHRVRPIKF